MKKLAVRILLNHVKRWATVDLLVMFKTRINSKQDRACRLMSLYDFWRKSDLLIKQQLRLECLSHAVLLFKKETIKIIIVRGNSEGREDCRTGTDAGLTLAAADVARWTKDERQIKSVSCRWSAVTEAARWIKCALFWSVCRRLKRSSADVLLSRSWLMGCTNRMRRCGRELETSKTSKTSHCYSGGFSRRIRASARSLDEIIPQKEDYQSIVVIC